MPTALLLFPAITINYRLAVSLQVMYTPTKLSSVALASVVLLYQSLLILPSTYHSSLVSALAPY
jgi:hypothetical protein